MSGKLDYGSLADFLSGAIKDAGAGAELPKETPPATPPPIAPETATAQDTPPSAEAMSTQDGETRNPKRKPSVKYAVKTAIKSQIAGKIPDPAGNHERKLVTVKRVQGIEDFDKTNNLLKIEGWTVRAAKAKNIKKGELVIFLEVDTFLPAKRHDDEKNAAEVDTPLTTGRNLEKAFAEVGNVKEFDGQRGYLVATQQFISPRTKRTIISQGHVYKLTQFEKIWADVHLQKLDFTGTDEAFAKMIREIDYTSFLGPGVRKWTDDTEPGSTLAPKFPKFIKKTTIERVQNCPNLFIKDKYKHQIFQESVKMDGASMTIYFVHKNSRYYSQLPPLSPAGVQYTQLPNGRFGVCSKNFEIPFDASSPYWRAALQANYPAKLSKIGKTIGIQGELVGDKIQGNMHNYPPNTVEFLVYSIYEIHGSTRWAPQQVEKFAAEHALRHVVVTGYGVIRDFARKHEDFQLKADLSMGDEGYVYKNCTDGRWFKVLSRHYILDKERADESEDEEDDGPGYVIDEEEADAWIDAHDAGELDDNEQLQDWLADWEEKWGGPVPGSDGITHVKDKKGKQLEKSPVTPKNRKNETITEKEQDTPKKMKKTPPNKKKTLTESERLKNMKIVEWLAMGNKELEKWKGYKGPRSW